MASDTPISVRKPNGELFTVDRATVRLHPASQPTCVIYTCRDLMGRERTFRPAHLVRVRRIDLSGSTGRPAALRFEAPDNTDSDLRELEAILRRIAKLESQLDAVNA